MLSGGKAYFKLFLSRTGWLYRGVLAKRIIPCLDVTDGRVVKGTNFVNLRDAGDPVECARAYDAQQADELVFLDITASSDGRATMVDVVRRTAACCFMPLTVGGGIRSVKDMREMLLAGADKVSLNTAAINRPDLINEGAAAFGSQCIVVAIDAKRQAPGKWGVSTHGGRKFVGLDAVEWAVEAERRGAGEILLTSMDADGAKTGYDIELSRAHSRDRQRRSGQPGPHGGSAGGGKGGRRPGGFHLPLWRIYGAGSQNLLCLQGHSGTASGGIAEIFFFERKWNSGT